MDEGRRAPQPQTQPQSRRLPAQGPDRGKGQRSAARHDQPGGPSCFVVLPDALHRLVVSSLRQDDVNHVISSCKSLGAVYREGIRSFRLSASSYRRIANGSASEESLVRYLERLPFLERIAADTDRAIQLLASAAAASSLRGGSLWLTTPQVLDMGARWSECREAPDECSSDGEADGPLLTLLGLVGQGTWPRLQRLTISYQPELLEAGLEALAAAFEKRGDEYGMLQALELDLAAEPSHPRRLQDEGLLGRLLASPCCGKLKVLKIRQSIELSRLSFAELVSHLRSPRGRRLQSLTFYWVPEASEVVTLADPAMLIKALADGCCPALQALEVPCLHPKGNVSPEAASAVFRWAEGPFSQSMKVFKCDVAFAGTVEPLMEGMRAGHGFPVLKTLSMGVARLSGGMIEELCLSMEAGAMPCLESLTLSMMDGPSLVRLMGSLSDNRSRCSATIKNLEAVGCRASDEEGEAVGRALAAGACPSLQYLGLAWCHHMGDRTARSIADALRAGAARRLEVLELSATSLGDEECLALRDVMQEGCTALQQVLFSSSMVTGARGRYGRLERGVTGQGT